MVVCARGRPGLVPDWTIFLLMVASTSMRGMGGSLKMCRAGP